MTPANRVDHLRQPFAQHQGDQPPAKQGQFSPQLLDANRPEQIGEECYSEREQEGVKLLHHSPACCQGTPNRAQYCSKRRAWLRTGSPSSASLAAVCRF